MKYYRDMTADRPNAPDSRRFSSWLGRLLWIVVATVTLAAVVVGIQTANRAWAKRTVLTRDIAALRLAATSEQERQAFDGIWQHADSLAFTPLDGEGSQLSLSGPKWANSVARIELEI